MFEDLPFEGMSKDLAFEGMLTDLPLRDRTAKHVAHWPLEATATN